jgi:pilus assembly protein CpaB
MPSAPANTSSSAVKFRFIAIGIALLCGLLATFLVNQYLQTTILKISGGQMVPTIAARANIPAGAALQAGMITTQNIPKAYLHFRAIPASDAGVALGQTIRNPIAAGQPVLWTDLDLESSLSLDQRLKSGDRAITIPITQVTGINGLIRPGNRVDLVAVIPEPDPHSAAGSSKTQLVAKTFLQNVTVLALDRELDQPDLLISSSQGGDAKSPANAVKVPDSNKKLPTTATLKVTPSQANLVAMIIRISPIQLVLRGRSDIVVEPVLDLAMGSVTSGSIFQTPNIVPPPADGFPTILEGGVNRGSAFWPNQPTDTTPRPEIQDVIRQLLEQRKSRGLPIPPELMKYVDPKSAPATPPPAPK